MPATRDLQSFGFVYGIAGTARGTTTSSGVFNIGTGFAKRVVFGFAIEDGIGLRNTLTDPAASPTISIGTYAYYRFITVDTAIPTQMRLRVYQSRTLSAASAVTTASRRETLATSVTGLLVKWLAFGY